jgi:acetyltransferase-like isoleucine patch superfamily enzyme
MIGALRRRLRAPSEWWQGMVGIIPGHFGYRLRYRYWKRRLHFLGRGVLIDRNVYFQNPQFISIDDNTWIDQGVMILAGPDTTDRARRYVENPDFTAERGEVHIGKCGHIAPGCLISGIGGVHISDECNLAAGTKVFSFSHHYRSDDDPRDSSIVFGPMVANEQQFMIEGPIFLGDNVGVALNSVILPGVSIGPRSFVGIQSVVFSSFEENSLIAGNPAKSVKSRFKDE